MPYCLYRICRAYLFLAERSSNRELIRHKAFVGWFCKSQSPHKSVNFIFISVAMTDTLNKNVRESTSAYKYVLSDL